MAGPTVTLAFGGDPANLSRTFDTLGKQAGQLGQRFDSAGKQVNQLDARMRNVEGTADDFETRAEGVGYAVSGLTDLMGFNASSTVMTATAFADLSGGAKRLGPELVALTARLRAMSAAQLATRLGVVGLAAGLGVLLLASRGSNEETEKTIETYGQLSEALEAARGVQEQYRAALEAGTASENMNRLQLDNVRAQMEETKKTQDTFTKALQDGNVALAQQTALGVDDADTRDRMLGQVQDEIALQNEISDLRARNNALLKGTTLEAEQLTAALDELSDAEEEVADATKRRDEAQRDVTASEKDLAEARKELADLIAVGADGLTDYEEALQDVEAADKAVAAAERASADTAQEIEAANRAVEQAVRGVTQAEGELTRARKDAETAQDKLADAEQRILDLREKASEAARDATVDISKAQNDSRKAQTELARAEGRLAQLRLGAETTAAGLADAEQDVSDARVRAEAADRDLTKANKDLADANATMAGTSDEARSAEEDRKDAADLLTTALGNVGAAEAGLVGAQAAVVTAEDEKAGAVRRHEAAEGALRDRIGERNARQAEAAALDNADVVFADKVKEAKEKVAGAEADLRDRRSELVGATNDLNGALLAEQGAAEAARGKMILLAGDSDALWAARDRLIKQKPELVGLFDATATATQPTTPPLMGPALMATTMASFFQRAGLGNLRPGAGGGTNIGTINLTAQTDATADGILGELLWAVRAMGR